MGCLLLCSVMLLLIVDSPCVVVSASFLAGVTSTELMVADVSVAVSLLADVT